MERMLATPADAEIILKLYELRTEPVLREARRWMTGEFWPNTAEEFFAVAQNPRDPHNAYFRQVTTYWEMAAAMVLHGAVSVELFVDFAPSAARRAIYPARVEFPRSTRRFYRFPK